MTSKLVVNTIEADTGISSVSFASSISMDSTSKFHFSAAGVDIGADTNINRPAAGVLGFNISGAEKLRIDTNGHLNTSGIVTAANFKSGVTNVHNLGVTLTGGQLDVGSNIKIGTAGVVTATSFVGSGANLTGITQTTINNNADNRVITGSGTANTLNGESSVVIDSNSNVIVGGTGVGNASTYSRNIVITGSSNRGMTIHTSDTSGANRKCCIFFGTGTSVGDMADGMLFYDHAGQYMHLSTAGAGTGVTKSSIRLHSDGTVRFDSTPADANSISLLIKSHKSRAVGDNNGIVFRDGSDHSQAAINITKQSTVNAASDLVFRTSDGAVTNTLQGIPERLRIGRAGQIGVAGANYGEARQTIVSGGASAAVSWSSNPFLLDMAGLGDIDYDGVFLRYRETANVTGNGLVYLGLCKSTTNCPAGRIGIPVGFITGVTYNSHFRVDKVGITPWPDSSGHRYEFYAIISDWASAGKLGIFYLTNSTN